MIPNELHTQVTQKELPGEAAVAGETPQTNTQTMTLRHYGLLDRPSAITPVDKCSSWATRRPTTSEASKIGMARMGSRAHRAWRHRGVVGAPHIYPPALARKPPELGWDLPRFARIRPKSATCGVWPESGRIRPNRPQTWSNPGQHRSKSGQTQSKPGQV